MTGIAIILALILISSSSTESQAGAKSESKFAPEGIHRLLESALVISHMCSLHLKAESKGYEAPISSCGILSCKLPESNVSNISPSLCRQMLAQNKYCHVPIYNTNLTTAGSLSINIAQSYDYRGRPRRLACNEHTVAADHGRCSDLGTYVLSLSLGLFKTEVSHWCCHK